MIALVLAGILAGEVDAPRLWSALEAYRGRPVVVSLWATWCKPCVEEFPVLVKLARERKDVAVVSVSIDEKEDRGALEAFVRERQPPFPVYAKAPGADEAFIDGVDPRWSGVVPATLSVTCDQPIGPAPAGANLAAGLSLDPEGGRLQVPLPAAVPLAARATFTVRVRDAAGHETRIVRTFAPPARLFADGFESGDTGAWSSASP